MPKTVNVSRPADGEGVVVSRVGTVGALQAPASALFDAVGPEDVVLAEAGREVAQPGGGNALLGRGGQDVVEHVAVHTFPAPGRDVLVADRLGARGQAEQLDHQVGAHLGQADAFSTDPDQGTARAGADFHQPGLIGAAERTDQGDRLPVVDPGGLSVGEDRRRHPG